jgi:DsbC/DsbD-like thiol-disulfide interchange protein
MALVQGASAELSSEWAVGHASRARLLAGNGIAGVELQLPDGWKTYWRNPGDAGGVPPSFDWSKSQNLASVKVLYPAPKRFGDSAGDTVGYKGTIVFPVEVKAKDPAKPIDLHLNLEYGVCKEICIPAEADLSLAIPPAKTPEASEELAEAVKHVPAAEGALRPGDPILDSARIDASGKKPRLVLEANFPGGAEHADIFIEGPQDVYVPLPKKIAEDASGKATFAVDLSDGPDVAELKGKPLKATLVSGNGQSEATFNVD